MPRTHNILVTRELSDEQQALAENLHLKVWVESAIEIRFRSHWSAVRDAVENTENPLFVFTSQNGVKAFHQFLKAGIEIPAAVPVFAVGGKTAKALKEAGIQPRVPEKQDGTGLAEFLAETLKSEELTPQILHFCGDKRRDELRQILSQHGFSVKDIVVYQTVLKQMKLPAQPVEAILFYSPSAVHAFRNSGGFEQDDIPELFAIGETTARELSMVSGRHVHISPEPATKSLLRFVSQFLNSESG